MMDRLLKISVITPSFNQGEYLEETILSVLNQKYSNLEYIVMDGGSTDNSVEIIKKYEKHIAFWISEKDIGQSHAINKGFRKATGDVVAYLNSDDKYCPDVFYKIADLFNKDLECMWLCGNVIFIDEYGKILLRKKSVYTPFILRYGTSSLYQPSVFIRREVLNSVGLLREDFHTIMDKEWFCRIAELYKPQITDLDISMFRWHPHSKSSSGRSTYHYKRYIEEVSDVSTRYLPSFSSLIRNFPIPTIFVFQLIARGIKFIERLKVILGIAIR